MDVYGQSPFDCRLQWGPEGVKRAAAAGHIVIIVDTLVFSTSMATILARGSVVRPVGSVAEAHAVAHRTGAIELLGRGSPTPEGWSHSPVSLTTVPAGRRMVYFSANGSLCCAAAAAAPAVLVGALINATAVATVAQALQVQLGRPITVVGCGERWIEEGTLRPALEDELGAGAILAAISGTKSAEASAAETLYRALGDRVPEMVWDSASGRELRARGFDGDVVHGGSIDLYAVVPVLSTEGWLVPWENVTP
jgi:2-phosphosulfolactate phosphatase